MIDDDMTSLERILTTLGHKEPDRVPFVFFLTLPVARDLGISIRDYVTIAENITEGQLRKRAKYHDDGVTSVASAAFEIEAWGGEVIYFDDGPPNSGEPPVRSFDDILSLTPPRISDCQCLQESLKAASILKESLASSAPVFGVVLSPFSLPVMQLGFDRYFELIYERRDLFDHLMKLNEEFCVEWANAQLAAGATVIAFYDSVGSPSIVPRDLYLETGYPSTKRTIARINGPTVTHFASGISLPIIGDVAETGTVGVGVSALEDLADMKQACLGKLTVVGNLNGIEMRHWSRMEAESQVKAAIAKAGPGGGFILSDNHGEIPWQVNESTLTAIADAVHTWGRYPLDWIEDSDK